MLITDEIETFKNFLKFLGANGIFNGFYGEASEHGKDKQKLEVRTLSMNHGEFTRVCYYPEKIEVDGGLDTEKNKDSEIWGEPSLILKRLSGFKTGDMELEFNNGEMRGNVGKGRFTYNVCEKNNPKDTFSPFNMANLAKKFDNGDFVIKIGEPLSWGKKLQFPYYIQIESSVIKNLITSRNTLVNPSLFSMKISEAGIVSISVVEETDDGGDGNDGFSFDVALLKDYNGKEMTFKFSNSFENIFTIINGTVNVWFGNGPIVIQYDEMVLNKKAKVEEKKIDVVYLIVNVVEDKKKKKKKKDSDKSDDKPKKDKKTSDTNSEESDESEELGEDEEDIEYASEESEVEEESEELEE